MKLVIAGVLLWSVQGFSPAAQQRRRRSPVGDHRPSWSMKGQSRDVGDRHDDDQPDHSHSMSSSRTHGSRRRDFLATGITAAAASVGSFTAGQRVPPTWAAMEDEAAVVASEAAAAAPAEAAGLAGQITLPPLGLGAWSWGDSLFWGYNKKNDDQLQQVFDFAVAKQRELAPSSSLLLDTAELYGLGRSETLIGDFAKPYDRDRIQVATKFAAVPLRMDAKTLVKACEASLQRLGLDAIDLYQIHFPNAYKNEVLWDGLALAYEKGLVKAVGVSNYGVDAIRACHDALAKRGIQLASNQIQMSLLYRYPLENGLLDACNDLGIQVLSYSPLALGMLTGKYTLDNPPAGPRKGLFANLKSTPDYDNLLSVMRSVADKHQVEGGSSTITLSQVALNWARAQGTVPIPGARTLSQVEKNFASLEWSLTEDEIATLDEAAAKVTTFTKPDIAPFPKVDKDTGMVLFDS